MPTGLERPLRTTVLIFLVTAAAIGAVTLVAREGDATSTSKVSPQWNAPALDLARFDRHLHPAIHVMHAPPIATPGERVVLWFDLACGLAESCSYQATLHTSRDRATFSSEALRVDPDDGRASAELVVPEGIDSLSYYVELREQQTGVTVRYPDQGVLDATIAPRLTTVALGSPRELSPERVIALPWGKGDGQVGLDSFEYNKGPNAIDVAPDGTIAILDNVNGRVHVFHPDSRSLDKIEFHSMARGDLAFDDTQYISILDYVGERTRESAVLVPQLYRVTRSGAQVGKYSVFATLPRLVDGRTVRDGSEYRDTPILDARGQALKRSAQIASRATPVLRFRYLGFDHSRAVDVHAGRAYDLTDRGGLGYIDLFERTSAGYVIVFEDVSVLRIAWFDVHGGVIDYVAAPTQRHAEVNPGANVAMGPDGSIYYMASTPDGIEIRKAVAEIIRRQRI